MSSADPLTIRPYRAQDNDAVIELFRNSVRRVAGRDYTREQILAWAPEQIDRHAWLMRCSSAHTFVAELGGRPVGFTLLEESGLLDLLYVDADQQGQGIASRLLERAESFARTRSLRRLHTQASITARPFFERRGFRLIASQLVSAGGQQFLNYRMEKRL